MNRIILIGNGFDLAHGLETSYKHFIDNYWEQELLAIKKNKFISCENNYFRLENIPDFNLWFSDKNTYCSLKKTLQNNNNKIDFKNKFLEIITEKSSLETWVDIESAYYYQLKECVTGHCDIKTLNEDFLGIKNLLIKYLKKVQQTGVEQLKDSVFKEKIISIIESEFDYDDFDKIGYKTLSGIPNKFPEEILCLNFNYTNTEEEYVKNKIFSNNHTTIHIHGELKNKNNPIIFGYGDEIGKEYAEIENLNNNEYLENIKSIKYLETDNYKKLLTFIESEQYQVFIFGHSCGLSDRTLLNTLFEHENCVSIKPFYYVDEEGMDNYSDIVRNISRNFNSKVLMRDRVVNKEQCQAFIEASKE